MNKLLILLFFLFASSNLIEAQTCGQVQNLSSTQELEISALLPALDTALKYEVLVDIDSHSNELKLIFDVEGGIPESSESYYTLTSDTTWLNMLEALELSRILIDNDSMVYVDLWKVAKGMRPPLYLPNSIPLRSAGEIARGLLKIAYFESDTVRKNAYRIWAKRALDSLATMQLPNGAFPFPDLRVYNDLTYTPIIQNFINSCGVDSVNVLQNGWIIDDKGTGEFNFDTGVIGTAYVDANGLLLGSNYNANIIDIANYFVNVRFNRNYNYNSFGLVSMNEAQFITGDPIYSERIEKTLRYSIYPGQIISGRWIDGHNASSRYHSILIQKVAPVIEFMNIIHPEFSLIRDMNIKALRNMIDYTLSCESSTGYLWLLEAYPIHSSVLPSSLKDTMRQLIGRHIRQSSINGKYLDVPTMGEYFELIGNYLQLNEFNQNDNSDISIYPNPANESITIDFKAFHSEIEEILVVDLQGKTVYNHEKISFSQNENTTKINLTDLLPGIYIISLKTKKGIYQKKLQIID
jgi:Secretion system C-terminal sorting domain